MNNNRAVTSKILTLNDLIQEENFNSWQDFVKVLMASPENYNNFYWRGHANANWSIIPFMESLQHLSRVLIIS